MTLNLLRKFSFNPKFSAYGALHGMFDYNKTPLTSFGTRCLVHKKITKHRTWAPCGTYVWYIGTDLEHYQCVECCIPSNHSTRIANTVEFISTFFPISRENSEDYLRQSVADIIALLADPNPTVPSISFGYYT